MIAALFAEHKSPEKSSALSAVSYNGDVTYTIPVNSSIPPVAFLTLTSKLKLFLLSMT